MLIFTGRFQPFHLGHLSIIDHLSTNYPDETICIAIIKDYPFLKEKDSFDKRVDIEIAKKDSLLNSESILQVITRILINRNYKNVVITLMPRASEESWEIIENLFDCKRKWVFTKDKMNCDSWEKVKKDFYCSKQEEVVVIPINKMVSGSSIRLLLNDEKYDELTNYLPNEMIEFYKSKATV